MSEVKGEETMKRGFAEETIDDERAGDNPLAYFKEFLRRKQAESDKFGMEGIHVPDVTGRSTTDAIRKRIGEDDSNFTNDSDFMAVWPNRPRGIEKDFLTKKILSEDGEEIKDSELARAYLDDEITNLEEKRQSLIEKNNNLKEGEISEPNRELFSEVADLIEKFEQRLEEIQQQAREQGGTPNEEELIGLEGALVRLQQAQNENKDIQASREITVNQTEIENLAGKISKFEKLRDNVEIDEREAKDIEEVRKRLVELPNIKFNEKFGEKLAEKRGEYEKRVTMDRKDIYGLDAKLKFEILSPLFRDEEVSPAALAEEMKLSTLRELETFESAARVIQAYTETGGKNLRKR